MLSLVSVNRVSAETLSVESRMLSFTCGGAVGWDTALQAERSQVRFPMVLLEFFIDIILPAALWPWLYAAANRNEYQEYLLGGKGGRCVRLTTLPTLQVDCLEIWEPKPPGTLRSCPGRYRVVLPLTFTWNATSIADSFNINYAEIMKVHASSSRFCILSWHLELMCVTRRLILYARILKTL